MTQLRIWAKHLFSAKEDLLFLGSCIPQVWMYAMLQHFDTFHFASMMSFYFGLGGCLLVVALLWLTNPKRTAPRWLSWAAGIILCAASISWALPFDLGEPVAIVISTLSGASAGWCFLQWFLVYSALSLKDAAGYVLLSFSLVAVATYLFTALSIILDVSTMLLFAPFPLAATLMCKKSLVRLKEPPACEHLDKQSAAPSPLHLRQIVPIALELAIYALVLGLLRGQGAQTDGLDIAAQLNLLLRAIFPLILVLWIGVQFKPKSFIDISQAILICIIITLLALALLGDSGAAVTAALVSLARNVVLVLLSVILLYIAHGSSYHPFTVYGTGRFIHTLSTQAGFAITTIFEVGDNFVGVSLNVVFFAIACIFVFLANRSVKTIRLFSAEGSLPSESNSAFIEARCDEIRKDFDLTDRELEVMKLIAKGRSRGYIAETLVISENTVRWHAKRLYAKLGIHSKQELLTLIDPE